MGHPILRGFHADPEVANRCHGINARHRARIFSKIGPIADLPGFCYLGWNQERNVFCWTGWMNQALEANGYSYTKTTWHYLQHLADHGFPESTILGVVAYMRMKQAEYNKWQSQYNYGSASESDDGFPREMIGPPKPKE